jgi:hypothetical protein
VYSVDPDQPLTPWDMAVISWVNSVDPDQPLTPWDMAVIPWVNSVDPDQPLTPWDMAVISWVNSVDPDQLAYSCHLIRICTGLILVNNLMNQKANRLDPDQMARM